MQFEILPVTRFRQNCSIVWCEITNRAAVIDPGGNLGEILNLIELLELEPEVALVTHGHFDHCGEVAEFAAVTGARIEGPHRGDAHLVEHLGEQETTFLNMARRRTEVAGHAADAMLKHLAQPRGKRAIRRYEPLRWLEHGDTISFGEEQLEVLHCPGHTKGHVAYFSRAARRAFVGDTLFRHRIGAWDHPDGNLPLLLDSIRTKLFPLGDDVGFVPGHGEASTFGHERRENPFVGDEAIAGWLSRRLGTPKSPPGDPEHL